jgi:O-antigen ligase
MVLLAFAPLLRGGDYFVALIPMEIISLCILIALGLRSVVAPALTHDERKFDPLVVVLLASPVLIGMLQLVPIPSTWWAALPGHARYVDALHDLDIATTQWRPITISPDATRASLLAGLPLIAAFLVGYLATVRQYRMLIRVVAIVAFAQVLLGLLQLSGGERSPFYFGMPTYGSPIGTMGTRNEFANLIAMALCGYVWLAYDDVRYAMRYQAGAPLTQGRFDDRHAMAAWVLGGLVLVVGILISHSRGGSFFGLGCALLALAVAGLRVFGWSRGWRFALPLAALLLVGAVAMVGLDAVVHRIAGEQLRSSAGFRGELWRSTWHAALAFMPFGSGWGTYDIAYRPFQSQVIVGYPNHAHNDYLELLLEGGLIFVALAAISAWVCTRRAVTLLAQSWRERTLDRESMLAAIAGIGLLGFLLHAGVDFPMRVPGNAVVACLLAGAFLRPLPPIFKPGAALTS